jgi:hypothetical protein
VKVLFKTAHGYLSFQPPQRGVEVPPMEYRQVAGSWEEVDLIGLEWPTPTPPNPGPNPPDPTPPTPTPPNTGIPAAIQPVERSASYIGRVKSWLLSLGLDLSGPCGAFSIVQNAAWYLRPSNPTVGLLDKPGGNNCRGYATDIIMFSDMNGQIIDCLGDGGGANIPQWGVSDTVDPDRWRPPVQP